MLRFEYADAQGVRHSPALGLDRLWSQAQRLYAEFDGADGATHVTDAFWPAAAPAFEDPTNPWPAPGAFGQHVPQVPEGCVYARVGGDDEAAGLRQALEACGVLHQTGRRPRDGYGNEYVELRVEAAAYEAMTSEGTYALGDGCLVEVLERDGGETPGRGDMAK